MANEIPAVSVIVPMYNVEAYIGEMLESVLYQTLKNFELIIIYDRSNDRSREIVESYIPKFDGRLSLIKYDKNPGGCAVPRNKGLEASRGKYIFFMDSDDVITQTALEEMYTIAESSQAEVVYFQNHGISQGTGADFLNNIRINETPLVKEVTVIINDLAYKLDCYLKFYFRSMTWLKLVRRDFLVSNDISFPVIYHEDNLWTLKLLCLSERFVVAPNVVYVYRKREGSETAPKDEFSKQLRYSMERTIKGMKMLDAFMDGLEFFKIHPEFRYAILNFYTTIDLNWTTQCCANLPPHVIFENLRNLFANDMGENSALISYLVTNNVMLIRNLIDANQKLAAVPPSPAAPQPVAPGESFSLRMR